MSQIRHCLALAGLILALAVNGAFAFDAENTEIPIKSGEAKLQECRGIRDDKTRIDCIADSLQIVAGNIHHRGPGYQYIRRTLEQTSREVRSAKTKAEAGAAIDKATATLKTAAQKPSNYAGPKPTAEKHFARFAQFTAKAKSVLRS